MNKYIIIVVICFFSLISCGIRGMNDTKQHTIQAIDRRGFDTIKHLPIYNGKYISKAKKNLRAQDFDNDTEDSENSELENPTAYYKQIYKNMLKNSDAKTSLGNKKINDTVNLNNQRMYLKKDDNVNNINKKLSNTSKNLQDLKSIEREKQISNIKELENTKKELENAKKELENTRKEWESSSPCPCINQEVTEMFKKSSQIKDKKKHK